MAPTFSASERAPGGDLLAGISRQTWLANRANNALQRPVFIGAISVGTFLIVIVSLVMAPRMPSVPRGPLASAPRPDTMSIAADAALARSKAIQADSALVAARAALSARHAAAPDSLVVVDTVRRDSISARVGAIAELLTRAEQAPLPTSYRSLADVLELRADPRVHALLDTLSEIEREREGFGAVGGVDPIFVALTTRASEVGRRISGIANERLTAMRMELGAASPKPAPTVPLEPAMDTARFAAIRDSANAAADTAAREVARLREVARGMDSREELARERATAIAPPLALLAAAFVLSGVIGFAFAFAGELRRPRVSDETETERVLRTRVLAVIEPAGPALERGRRQADRAAPPYLEPSGEGYQLAYLSLATKNPTQLGVTITGDDGDIAAIVACNLAAVAADEARSVIMFDLTSSARASAVLRARSTPGVAEVAGGDASWPDVTVAARVGRDKTIDLIPRGTRTATPQDVIALIARDEARFSRYYDAVFLLIDASDASAGAVAALSDHDIVYCARPGITPLNLLQHHLTKLRESSAFIRGIVLWRGPKPLLTSPRDRDARSVRTTPPSVALANS